MHKSKTIEADRHWLNKATCMKMNENGMLGAPLPNARVLVVFNESTPVGRLIQALKSDPELDLVACRPSLPKALEWLANDGADVILVYSQAWNQEWIQGIRECHKRCPGCDVVVLADRIDANDTWACIEAGAVGYLLGGDEQIGAVLKGIKELKHGGAPLDALVARQLLERIATTPALPLQTKAPMVHEEKKSPAAPVPIESMLEQLTSREQDILALLARGDTYAELAAVLGITVRTVETHAKNIYRKMSVHSRSEAVFEAHRAGLLESWL